MSNEDLMKPRYLVEFDEYPHADYIKGLIIEFENEKEIFHTGRPEYVSKWYLKKDAGGKIGGQCESFFAKYPKVFRLMEWWEMREESDMPEYVKYEEVFHKVIEWRKSASGLECRIKGARGAYHAITFFPATETEYNNYINNQNK